MSERTAEAGALGLRRRGWLSYLEERFTRVTSSVAYIPQLDGLRALALLLVIGHHVFAIYLQNTHRLGTQKLPQDWGLIYSRSPLVGWGLNLAFGVPIFFAISGFVVSMPFARAALHRLKMPSTKLYLLRRLIRLEPPYFINLTLMFAWLVIGHHRPRWFMVILFHVFGPHFLASMAYLHAAIFGEASWVNGIAWTLEIEIQFYLLMPLIAQIFKLRGEVVRRVVWMALMMGSALFDQMIVPHLHNPRVGLSILGHFEFFLAGILLADIYLDPPKGLKWGPRVADAWALVSAALLVYVLHWQGGVAWVEPLLVAALYFGVFRGEWAGRVFRSRWLTIPGTMCYTIYLYHFFLIERLMPWTVRLLPPVHSLLFDSVVQMVLMVPVLVGVSAILYLVTERPFVVLSHTATRRWRPVAAAPETGAQQVGA